MSTAQNMLDDLNDRINDAANAQVSAAIKLVYLNRGLAAMFPKIYRVVSDTTLVTVAGQWEYTIPAVVGDNTKMLRIDLADAYGRNTALDSFEILPTQAGRKLILASAPSVSGRAFRFVAAKQLTQFAAAGDTYDGPPGTEELPVWYALGLVEARRVDDRADYTRYSTVAAQNGVDIGEVMNASQFAFAQFELLLDRFAMPLPAQAG